MCGNIHHSHSVLIRSLGLILIQEYNDRRNELAVVIETKGAVTFPGLLTKAWKAKHEQQMHWPQEHPCRHCYNSTDEQSFAARALIRDHSCSSRNFKASIWGFRHRANCEHS